MIFILGPFGSIYKISKFVSEKLLLKSQISEKALGK